MWSYGSAEIGAYNYMIFCLALCHKNGRVESVIGRASHGYQRTDAFYNHGQEVYYHGKAEISANTSLGM